MKQALLYAAVLLFASLSVSAQTPAPSQQQQPSASAAVPTIRVTSRLVFLDVTVLDKKGHPVVSGLTKDDFVITEDKKPQRIFSFEPPEVHTLDLHPGAPNSDGEAPRTILVLDQLNSSFEDFAYIRYEVHRYLVTRPKELRSPTELMLVGNESLQLLQSWTRSREDLFDALTHIPAVLPYKQMNGSFWIERLPQSIDALQQIALQTQGVSGRKNIIWVGRGMPSLDPVRFPGDELDALQQYLHQTTNLLVDSRISLFVIYPGLSVRGYRVPFSAEDADADLGDDDPFLQGINFGVLTNETGGKLFYNRNDVDQEMREARTLGSEYYTLTYQPHNGNDNGRFRRIRVTLRNPNLLALTKTGYFAPDSKAHAVPHEQTLAALSEAVYSTIPLKSVNLFIGNIVRHPDAQTAQFTVFIRGKDLDWVNNADGQPSVDLALAAASLNRDGKVLASRIFFTSATSTLPDPDQLSPYPVRLLLNIRTPPKTRSVRVVVETRPANRIGSASLDHATLDAAPALPTPEPQLSRTRPTRATP